MTLSLTCVRGDVLIIDTTWKCEVFMLDPTAAVKYPFTGTRIFKQVGQANSVIETRICGDATRRPHDHGWYITCGLTMVDLY